MRRRRRRRRFLRRKRRPLPHLLLPRLGGRRRSGLRVRSSILVGIVPPLGATHPRVVPIAVGTASPGPSNPIDRSSPPRAAHPRPRRFRMESGAGAGKRGDFESSADAGGFGPRGGEFDAAAEISRVRARHETRHDRGGNFRRARSRQRPSHREGRRDAADGRRPIGGDDRPGGIDPKMRRAGGGVGRILPVFRAGHSSPVPADRSGGIAGDGRRRDGPPRVREGGAVAGRDYGGRFDRDGRHGRRDGADRRREERRRRRRWRRWKRWRRRRKSLSIARRGNGRRTVRASGRRRECGIDSGRGRNFDRGDERRSSVDSRGQGRKFRDDRDSSRRLRPHISGRADERGPIVVDRERERSRIVRAPPRSRHSRRHGRRSHPPRRRSRLLLRRPDRSTFGGLSRDGPPRHIFAGRDVRSEPVAADGGRAHLRRRTRPRGRRRTESRSCVGIDVERDGRSIEVVGVRTGAQSRRGEQQADGHSGRGGVSFHDGD
mmetsp:Transcript_55435/g.166208  ORF Transcript_55435/g.166208 Transcript_55435/m.166208 type:complete len:490 (-) Transcript_55435:317-1786(-)